MTASTVERTPVTPLAAAATHEVVVSLYAKRKEIYPRARIGERLGYFQTWRWVMVWATQIVFYGLPWLTWNGRQAVLFDLAARKFYLLGLVLWPQDVIYLTALLIISALSLFLFTAVGGRLWCGYACPQTVYTEIFMWIERRIEGDRAKRMALDRASWSAHKLLRKGAKHGAWIALALWTGFTFVGYFTPIHALVDDAAAFQVSGWSLFWGLFYSAATYGNAGWLREQVCLYMCPYARFQSAMFDRDTLIVTYDQERGEPRGAGTKSASRSSLGLGDCVDCGLCVQVCPTGIDIRKGLQYECIGCAACIDACNYVMDRTGLPRKLIRYATSNGLVNHFTPRQMWSHVARPRVLVYGAILFAIIGATLATLALRIPLKVDVIRDRGALAREVDDGRIENVYRLQVMNTAETNRQYSISVRAPSGATGLSGLHVASEPDFEVAPASTRTIVLRLQADAGVAPGSHPIQLKVSAQDAPAITVTEKTTFLGLRR